MHCNTLQHVSAVVHVAVLQHTATHLNIIRIYSSPLALPLSHSSSRSPSSLSLFPTRSLYFSLSLTVPLSLSLSLACSILLRISAPSTQHCCMHIHCTSCCKHIHFESHSNLGLNNSDPIATMKRCRRDQDLHHYAQLRKFASAKVHSQVFSHGADSILTCVRIPLNLGLQWRLG